MAGNIRTAQKCAAVIIVLMSGILLVTALFRPPDATALQLSTRALAIADITPGVTTTHSFKFSFVSTDAVGSVAFEYCTNPFLDMPCDAPAGVDVSGAALSSQTGEADFTIQSATTNKLILTRPTASSPVNNDSTYVFDNVVNPGPAEGTFYVRLSTHASADASDPFIDFGAVVNSTAKEVTLSTEVPPILKFCVGLTLADDCDTADDNLIDLGELRTTQVSRGTSQMLAATNADFGLAIAAYGFTLTSGNNFIPALTSPTVSAPGNAQFGINLRDNSDPDIGQEPSGNGIANPAGDYGIANRYVFRPGDVVATSPDATDTRKFTVSYIANVPPSQAPGVYTATITYICSATF